MPPAFYRELAICLLLALITWLFGWVWVQSDHLATFADDSTSYLLLGQFLTHAPQMAAELRPYALSEIQYPPLFPWLIGWFDSGTSLAGARQLVILMYALAMASVWLLARPRLNTALSVLLMAWVLCSPLPWVMLKSIHSEALYLALSMLTLRCVGDSRHAAIYGAGVLLALTFLTRTVALALWLAIACALVLNWREQRGRYLPTLMIPVVVQVVWYVLRPKGDDMYSSLLSDYLSGRESISRIFLDIPFMAGRIAHEWHRLFALFNDGLGLRLVSYAIGLGAIAGAVCRAWRRQIDGCYFLIYLGVLLVWPYPAETARLLWPIMPLGLLLALEAYAGLIRRYQPPQAAHAALALPSVLIAFGFFTFVQRAGDTREVSPGLRLAELTEYFLHADSTHAMREAGNTAALLQMFDEIQRQTPASARVLWSNPKYLWRYGRRVGVPGYASWGRNELLLAIREQRLDYVLMTLTNGADLQRNFLDTTRWQNLLAGCLADQRVVRNAVTGEPRALLSKIEPGTSCR